MKQEDTICWKINRCVESLEMILRKNEIDPEEFGRLLHGIRIDAQKMETAIRNRKEFMQNSGSENDYQKIKKERGELDEKNKISSFEEKKVDPDHSYHFTIKQNNEIVYDQEVHGAVLSIVEEISDIDKDGSMFGTTQKLFFGHPLTIWYGFDQLSQAMEGKKMELLGALREAVEKKKFVDPEVKRKILHAANYSNRKNK